MKRRTKAILLIGCLAITTASGSLFALTVALGHALDPHGACATGFSRLIDCNYHFSSRATHQGTPVFTTPASTSASRARDTFQPGYEAMTWAIAQCPQNRIARRLLCAVPSAAAPLQAASDEQSTGLPRPRPWLLTTAKDSPFIKAVHVETPLDLAGVLRFYRAELARRGWTENDGAVVEPHRSVIAFTTPDGPALLRLTRQADRTVADLALRKPVDTSAEIKPQPGQARLRLGNATDQTAVITINDQTFTFAAHAGHALTEDPGSGRKAADSAEIHLPPGKYVVSFKFADGASENREFEFAADETWGLLAGLADVPLPVRLY